MEQVLKEVRKKFHFSPSPTLTRLGCGYMNISSDFWMVKSHLGHTQFTADWALARVNAIADDDTYSLVLCVLLFIL